jgi:iron complex outermembrane recepter protein
MRVAFALALLAGSVLSGRASAQGADDSSRVEEIVVTAERREQSLRDTPISIVAMSPRTLENRQITGISDLASQVPALKLTPHPNASTTPRVFIRGIGSGDDTVTQDPSVAVYVDGVYIARQGGLATEVADLERIEVLRGPQGSLYGRNATGGAINFITKSPVLGQFSGRQAIELGSRNLFRARTSLNIPIGDTAAIQIGYLHSQQDGYVKNTGPGIDRWGDKYRDAFRLAARWAPSDKLDFRYVYDGADVRDTPPYMPQVPLYPAVGVRPTEGPPQVVNLQRNSTVPQGHALTTTWDANDHLTVKSITSYRVLRNRTNQNFLPGPPSPLTVNFFRDRNEQFTQELQFVGDLLDGQVKYVAGAYYFEEDSKTFFYTIGRNAIRVDRYITARNTAVAGFGQVIYTPDVLDSRLHLTLGARYSRDGRQATLQTVNNPPVGAPMASVPGAGKRSFDDFSPTLTAAFDVTPEVNAYVKAARGYKSGGFNVRASTVARFDAGFEPEHLTSYEGGVKASLLDHRLEANLAAFTYDYRDIQVSVSSDPLNPPLRDVLNAGKGKFSGWEMDVTAAPVRGLSLTANASSLSAKYQTILDSTGRNVASSYVVSDAPRYSYSLAADYRTALSSLGELGMFVAWNWQDRQYTNSADRRYVQHPYGLLSARVSVSKIKAGPTDLTLAVWGQNLTNKTYYAVFTNIGAPAAVFGDPRSFGVSLTADF